LIKAVDFERFRLALFKNRIFNSLYQGYSKEMNPILKTLPKFCTTKNLFK